MYIKLLHTPQESDGRWREKLSRQAIIILKKKKKSPARERERNRVREYEERGPSVAWHETPCQTGSVVHCGEYLISYSIFNPFSPALLIVTIIPPFDTYTFPRAFIYIYIRVSPLFYVHTYTYCLWFFFFYHHHTICTCIACQKVYCAKE